MSDPINNPPKFAVPYLRVSGRGQVLGDGFDRQIETIQKRAEYDNWSLLPEVREEGVTGTKEAVDRPALSALLEKLSSSQDCKTIIVERADRLARDLIVGELLLKECRSLGIRVIEAESGRDMTADDSDDPTSKLIRQILGAVAEFDKSSIVLKLRKARQRKKARTNGREGKEGVKPFGALDGEFDTLRRILELQKAGHGATKIARILNSENRKPRHGVRWIRQSVHGILKRKG
jgi:DNA invertase Pin-like site-specific DNA recombinase